LNQIVGPNKEVTEVMAVEMQQRSIFFDWVVLPEVTEIPDYSVVKQIARKIVEISRMGEDEVKVQRANIESLSDTWRSYEKKAL
jgi:hypothetical protein